MKHLEFSKEYLFGLSLEENLKQDPKHKHKEKE